MVTTKWIWIRIINNRSSMRTKYRVSAMAAWCVSLLFMLTGCLDDDLSWGSDTDDKLLMNTNVTPITSALVKEVDGTWRATKCVPLVGEGRIVDNFADGLIKAAGVTGGRFTPMLDTDLTNVAEFGGSLVAADAIEGQIVSVRDLNRTYSGGQVAGFVYRMADPSLLTLDVLKVFQLQTFLNGNPQEIRKAGDDGGLLGLNLLNIASNNKNQGVTVSAYFDKPFDEIKLLVGGVNAKVLESFRMYYAFVGENETKYCTKGSRYFPDSKVHYGTGWTSFAKFDAEDVVDANLENGAGMAVIKAGKITIDTGKEIPVGSEVGFVMTGGSLLELGIGSTTKLTTYDQNDNEVEEVAIAKVLGLSAIGGGKNAISMVTTKPCRQVRLNITGLTIDLGGSSIKYAYVKDPAEVDASSYFSLHDVTITGNSYLLSAPKNGKTIWVVQKFPEGARPSVTGNKVIGMTVDGNYVISGTYINEEGYSVTDQMVITRDTHLGEGCSQIIGSEFEAEACAPLGSSGGGLIIFDKFQNPEKLADDDWFTYAKYASGLSLAKGEGIVAIQTQKPVNPEKKKIKTGFVMQTSNQLLGLDLLNFFLIRLYNDGVKVAEQAVDNSNVADVGLLGSQGNKIRVGFTTDKTFDRIELWSAGVLNLKVSEYRLYGAYYEDAVANCVSANPATACIELLTPTSHGAKIDYEKTTLAGGATVGISYNNLGNLLDNDLESGAYISNIAEVGVAKQFAIKFDEINDSNKGTQIGFILKNPSGILDVNLLDGTVIELYHQGVLVGKSGIGDLLNLQLIGYTGRTFVETTSQTTAFDEIVITIGKGLGLIGGGIELTGAYIRRDSDQDGIPDCAEDEEAAIAPSILDVSPLSQHICLRSNPPIVLNVKGGNKQADYKLVFNDYYTGSTFVKICPLIDDKFTIQTQDVKPGNYYVAIHDLNDKIEFNGINVMVHPEQTTWKAESKSTDWDDWANWTDGVPWTCTDVVIPGNCKNYPVLIDKNEHEGYHCRYIHFCSGGEVVNTHKLEYSKSWVELSLTGGRYYMLSAPLKSMVTGDMFIPNTLNGNHGNHQENDYFKELSMGTCIESRFTPIVYQRLWSCNANGQTIEGTVNLKPDATLWTRPFNDLTQVYTPGMGFSMKAGENPVRYTFRFPKEHTIYHYVYNNGSTAGQATSEIDRSHTGRFIYENASNSVTWPYSVIAKNQQQGNTFIVGNPFMAHIDLKQFMSENQGKITSVKVYDGNSNNTFILADGQLMGTNEGLAYLAPMQSFFVTTAKNQSQVQVNFTEKMLVQQPSVGLYSNQSMVSDIRNVHRSAANISADRLRITAYSRAHSASCLLTINQHATDTYHVGEDSPILIDNEVPPVIAVFTEADGRALDIQQFSNRKVIPLGFSLKSKAETVITINYSNNSEWKNWELVDKYTGRRYAIKNQETIIDLGSIGTHVGRFCLVKR